MKSLHMAITKFQPIPLLNGQSKYLILVASSFNNGHSLSPFDCLFRHNNISLVVFSPSEIFVFILLVLRLSIVTFEQGVACLTRSDSTDLWGATMLPLQEMEPEHVAFNYVLQLMQTNKEIVIFF